jgi:hypothetical protein
MKIPSDKLTLLCLIILILLTWTGKCKQVCLIWCIKGANNAYRNVKDILRLG